MHFMTHLLFNKIYCDYFYDESKNNFLMNFKLMKIIDFCVQYIDFIKL